MGPIKIIIYYLCKRHIGPKCIILLEKYRPWNSSSL